MKHQHIVPREEGWGVKKEGAKRASKVFTDRSEALSYATELAQKHQVCMVLHDQDGKIQEFDCQPRVNNQHVLKDGKQWAVLSPGAEMIQKTFPNKGKALNYAYSVAKKHEVCMVVHTKNGDYKSINCPPHDSAPSLFEVFRMRMQI